MENHKPSGYAMQEMLKHNDVISTDEPLLNHYELRPATFGKQISGHNKHDLERNTVNHTIERTKPFLIPGTSGEPAGES